MIKKIILICLVFFTVFSMPGNAQNAKEIVKTSYDKMHGETLKSELTIKIVRPDWSREMGAKVWLKGDNYSMILITSPSKDEGTAFLKIKKEVWNWIPSVERTIKLPPSMMSQSWMGTDFTNDDLVKEVSIVEDYTHTLLGTEKIGSYDCYKIEMVPKSGTSIVWGKIITWIGKDNYLQILSEFFDEDGALVNTMKSSNIKKMGGRVIPLRYDMIPADKKGHSTVLSYTSIVFNDNIDDGFFTVKNMKELK